MPAVWAIAAVLAGLPGLLIAAPLMAAQGPPQGPPPALVEVAPVKAQSVQAKITLTGNAEAHRSVVVASRVEERVAMGEVEEGDAVKKGQVLVRLEREQLARQAGEAAAALQEAEAARDQLQRDLERKETLFKSKSIPLKTLEDARTDFIRAQAAAQRAKERLAILADDLASALVRAPRDGVVTKRLAYRGEWVKKGGPVLELQVLDPLKVVVPVPERYLPSLSVGQAVEVTADALPGQAFPGQIQAIIPSGDPNSRTFPVQVRLANPRGEVKAGMLMRVTFSVGGDHEALLVPKDALVVSGETASLLVVADGAARPVPVTVVAGHGGLMEVKGAIKPGQMVVTVGNERLRPGQPVRVRQPGAAQP
ncbi:MAG: efflux RND transporter periplasmic adaptor subunit [Pseudomonadota bacterium]